MSLNRYLLPFNTLLFALAVPLFAGPFEDLNLQAGRWYQVPNSHMESVKPPSTYGIAWSSTTGNPINPWSSGTYDTLRDRLIVWGGGHGDYAGNELYAFNVNTLSWQRLTNPSDPTCSVPVVNGICADESSGVYQDGKPRSRHTYELIEYVPGLNNTFDSFCSFGGSGFYPGGQTGSARMDCYSFASNQWQKKADAPSYGTGGCSAYDPVNKQAWAHAVNRRLARYDPATDTWATRSTSDNDVYYMNCEIDPVRRRFIAIGDRTSGYGGPAAIAWNNIDTIGSITRTTLATTGDKAMESVNNPGLTYDSFNDKFVAWGGGADVYVLNLVSHVWTRVTPDSANTVIPKSTLPDGSVSSSSQTPNGTYGRFRYMPNKNAFILVTSVNQDVYFYKLSPGGGSPPDTTKPKAPRNLRVQ
jgi:hypothetical protein